jgi:hypothetical protein
MSDLVDELFGTGYYPGSKQKRREKAFSPEFVSDPWQDQGFTKTVDGVEQTLYTVGALATALGVSTPTLRKWIREGRIPQAPYRLPSNMIVQGENVAGRRLYTAELINVTVDVFREHGILGSKRIVWDQYEEVSIELLEKWTRIYENRKSA